MNSATEKEEKNRYAVDEWSPIFLAPGTGFVEDMFSTDWGSGIALGLFKCVTFIVHFISIIISVRRGRKGKTTSTEVGYLYSGKEGRQSA